MTDFVHTENTEGYGCPQADEVGEQQLSKIGQQLKEKKYISTDDTDGNRWRSASGLCGRTAFD